MADIMKLAAFAVARMRTALLKLRHLPRGRKSAVTAGIDAVISAAIAASVVLSFEALCACAIAPLGGWPAALGFAVLTCGANRLTGVYDQVLRHYDGRRLSPLLAGTALAAAAGTAALAWAFGLPGLLAGPAVWFALFGSLIAWRLLSTQILDLSATPQPRSSRRIAVYGAGFAGAELSRSLAREPSCRVVAFLDDNQSLWGRKLHGIRIFAPAALPGLVDAAAVDQVIVAMPSITVSRRSELLNTLAELSIEVRTVPSILEIVSGKGRVTAVRDVRPEELLSREPVAPLPGLIESELQGCSVLVTGGGGSIGGALCREIIRHAPARLVIFEVSEFALYTIDRELRGIAAAIGAATEIVPVLGSVLSPRDIDRAIAENEVDIVYHGAAYKHVPLVEYNPLRGIENNVFGTLNTAEAVIRRGVRRMVFISTDKAVRPTSVMGASKRVAEKVVEALHRRGGKTSFAFVRFGNVLDSAGSVVPLFREQIARGGPVTVTDPEVVRYFMTIQEAAELVIQAGAMSSAGCEVYHLDMGEPVRIADLARKLIHLSGFRVQEGGRREGDIEIRFVGLRPGEKLFEELLVTGTSDPTDHPRIFRARDALAEWPVMQEFLRRLRRAIDEGDQENAKALLGDVVENYRTPAPANRAPVADKARLTIVSSR